MRITDTSDLWWKSAVVYCLDVETYLDSDGDGVGDLAGLAQRIDYLAQLGITCLWLMPFYPSPDRDDCYDVKDFYGVDPRLGNHGELVEVIRTAHDRGIRVIADLIFNHTSDQHPWFVSSGTTTWWRTCSTATRRWCTTAPCRSRWRDMATAGSACDLLQIPERAAREIVRPRGTIRLTRLLGLLKRRGITCALV